MKKKLFCILMIVALLMSGMVSADTAVLPLVANDNGMQLFNFLKTFNVDSKNSSVYINWAPGTKNSPNYVNWETGATCSKTPPYALDGLTHCSGYVSAVCNVAGIPMLHPPLPVNNVDDGMTAASDVHLATAQGKWLVNHGLAHNWQKAADPYQAQSLANKGYFVVAVYESPDATKPGHIAIILPNAYTADALSAFSTQGPLETQAGSRNLFGLNDSVLPGYIANGFSAHPGAWTNATSYALQFHYYTVNVNWQNYLNR
ncbi:MAG: hypothetical protein WCP79_00120 [Bacillota bacterium]